MENIQAAIGADLCSQAQVSASSSAQSGSLANADQTSAGNRHQRIHSSVDGQDKRLDHGSRRRRGASNRTHRKKARHEARLMLRGLRPETTESTTAVSAIMAASTSAERLQGLEPARAAPVHAGSACELSRPNKVRLRNCERLTS